MKRKFVRISSLLFAVSVLVTLLCSNSRARSFEAPEVIRKKIIGQPHNSVDSFKPRATIIGQKRPLSKPKSDITVPLKHTSDEFSTPSKTLLSQNTQPVYNPEGKIDPFQPLFADKPQSRNNILVPFDSGRKNKTALEKIDLSQLKLTGIILAPSGNKGLVQESSGRGHVIAKDTYIGTRGGRVSRVQKGKVIVEEKMKDVYGNILIAKQELKLNKAE